MTHLCPCSRTQILPSLAESWSERPGENGTSIFTFELRRGVEFHDGTQWNSTVAAANFANVLAEPLVDADYHGW
jgi:ABC-type transport system substrate-binding protein